jgi:hypothetical protein
MATYYAVAAGNVDDAIWATTPTGTGQVVTFDPADILVANNRAVVINVNLTVAQIRNDAFSGGTAAGNFTLGADTTLTANVQAGTVACLLYSASAPSSSTITGNITGGTVNNAHGLVMTGTETGSLTINGNLIGGTAAATGAAVSGDGSVFINGNITGNAAQLSHGLSISGTNTVTISGVITGGTHTASNNYSHGVLVSGNATLIVSGEIRGSLSALAFGLSMSQGSATITATLLAGSGSAHALVLSGTASATINANVLGVIGRSAPIISLTGGSSAVTIYGNVAAGAGNAVSASAGTVNIIGDVTGSSLAGVVGLSLGAASVCNIVGTVRGGTLTGASAISSGVVNIVGDLFGGTGQGTRAVFNPINLNAVGNVFAGPGGDSQGIRCDNAGYRLTITGDVFGSIATNGNSGVYTFGAGECDILGTAIGGAVSVNSAGVWNANASAVIRVKRAKGNGFGPGSVGFAGSYVGLRNDAASVNVFVDEIEFGDLGAAPVSGCVQISDKSTNAAIFYRAGQSKKTLVDPATVGDYPTPGNVRLGTTYEFGNKTGTCAVPTAAQVLLGVPVDNTTGTASIAYADVQSACAAALAAFSNGRLANVATVQSVGQQIADAVS